VPRHGILAWADRYRAWVPLGSAFGGRAVRGAHPTTEVIGTSRRYDATVHESGRAIDCRFHCHLRSLRRANELAAGGQAAHCSISALHMAQA